MICEDFVETRPGLQARVDDRPQALHPRARLEGGDGGRQTFEIVAVQGGDVGGHLPVPEWAAGGAQEDRACIGGKEQAAEPVDLGPRAAGQPAQRGGAQHGQCRPVGTRGGARDDDPGDPDGQRGALESQLLL